MAAENQSILRRSIAGLRARFRRRGTARAMTARRRTPTAENPPEASTGKPAAPSRVRMLLGIPAAALVVGGAVFGISLLTNDEPVPLNNAIWLNKAWTYGSRSPSEIADLAAQLQQNQIGKVYAYVSTLNTIDNDRWTGGAAGESSFMDSRDAVAAFTAALKAQHPTVEIYGWIEIWADTGGLDGYRLDDEALHSNIADFSKRMIDDLGMDGIFLDVRPLFHGSDDFIRLIRNVRAAIGTENPIAVAIPADLTPNAPGLPPLAMIAPGTMWTPEYKQRVVISADEVVLLMYQSYRQQPVDYINWVAYHVATYLSLLETNTRILISVPNYSPPSTAHHPAVETISAALDGVKFGLARLDEEKQSLLTGIAIYSDRDLEQAQWDVFQEKWLSPS